MDDPDAPAPARFGLVPRAVADPDAADPSLPAADSRDAMDSRPDISGRPIASRALWERGGNAAEAEAAPAAEEAEGPEGLPEPPL